MSDEVSVPVVYGVKFDQLAEQWPCSKMSTTGTIPIAARAAGWAGAK